MDPEEIKPGYERVFTVTDYNDGPLKGIANHEGKPHFYECIFDEGEDEYSELFRLTPLDADTFRLAMDDWAIWRRWEDAFHAGKVDISTHPALPHETARHEELNQTLGRLLVTDPQKAVTKVARFEAIGDPNVPKGVLRPLQVKWSKP